MKIPILKWSFPASFKLYLPIILALLALWANWAQADSSRPAYLDVEELQPGVLQVVWKQPMGLKQSAGLKPVFPASFKVTSPVTRLRTGNALIEKWFMTCGAGELTGALIGIEGLAQANNEALLRVQFSHGELFRTVLRPNQAFVELAGTEGSGDQANGILHSLKGFMNPWLFVVLLLVAWLLSLTQTARQRGVLLCAAALLAGGLCGHALGGLPLPQNLFGPPMPSEQEVRRVLNGLMLNTYRAFMLDNDQDIYDVLARSVAGGYLQEVYLDNKEALRMDVTAGALSTIDRLDLKSISDLHRIEDGGLTMQASWDVYGAVQHDQHIHYRCNTYKAQVGIRPMDGYWKLTQVQLLDEKRVL